MSVMGAVVLGSPGPYVYPKITTLVYNGVAYQIPRLRFGDIQTLRSKALVHQDVPFAAPEWPKEGELKLTFMVRCQIFRGMMVTALNRVYLWEEFFRAYIGRPMSIIHPIYAKRFFGVITSMGYTEIDAEHVNMELGYTVCEYADLVPEQLGWP